MTPTSATGDRAGFTLVEVMVVVAVLGLATAAVVLTVPGREADLAHQAGSFAARLGRAREEAVMSGQAVEASLTASGYRFESVAGGQRQALTGPFRPEEWPAGTRAYATEGGRIAFDPTGAAQGGRIVITRDGRVAEVLVDAAGKVTVHAPKG